MSIYQTAYIPTSLKDTVHISRNLPFDNITSSEHQPNMDLQSLIRDEVTGDAADYTLFPEELLGSGGFGSVYRGEERESKRVVAIKVIETKLTDDNNNELLAMLNEVQHLKTIRNDNILEYVSSYISNNQLHIVTEYIKGHDMGNIARSKRLSPVQVAYVCKSTLNALNVMHEDSVAHRDVKGGNIMMDTGGKVKLMDLGLSVRTDCGVRTISGTVLYMAPELSRGDFYHCNIDIWSLGITALALFNGKPPLYGSKQEVILKKLRNNKIPSLDYRKHVKDDMRDFVLACLDVNPKTRPSAATLLKHPFLKNVATQPQMQQLMDDAEEAEKHRKRLAGCTIL